MDNGWHVRSKLNRMCETLMYLEHFMDFAELLHNFPCYVICVFQSSNKLYIITGVKNHSTFVCRCHFVVLSYVTDISVWFLRKLGTKF